MKLIANISILAGTFAIGLATAFADMAVQRPPNIIFILADDLGYGDLSCYGQQKFSTPNIDRLAKEGMKFTSFYSGNTVCAPSSSEASTTGTPAANASASLRPPS